MKFERMMERNLQQHFGYVQKFSEADLMIDEDEQFLINHLDQKDARAIRIESAKTHKKRTSRIRKFADFRETVKKGESADMWQCHEWNPINTGSFKNVSDPRRGHKVRAFGKKECRDYTADRFNPRVYEFRGDNTPDRVLEKYQTPELTWELEYAMFPAWYDYSYEMTMRVEDEYANIYNALKRMIEYNKILQSSKLTENLINIINSCSDNRKW